MNKNTLSSMNENPLSEHTFGTSVKSLPPVQETVHAYLTQIRQFPLLTAEQNNALAVKYWKTADSKSAYCLATSNLRLVVKIALEYQRKWVFDLMDMIQEGNVGLVQAIKKYDPFRGVKFSFYAAYWIKAHILKYIIDNLRLVKIGTNKTDRMLFYNLRKEKNRLEQKGFSPEPEQLAKALDTDREKIIEMEQRLDGNEISLDACKAESWTEPQCTGINGSREVFDNILADQELFGLVRQKLEIFKTSLDSRRQDIFDKRILAETPVTLQKIGKRYGITKERVRQIEKGLKTDVKRYLQEAYPELQMPLRPVLSRQSATAGETRYIN